MIKYRADIDGLRAIAVMLVVCFHIGGYPRNGFVGVDVFFVISGYLITKIILGEALAGNFSIIRFYERRIRRLFPALFAVLIVTTICVYIIFLPNDIQSYGYSLLASLGFVSNILFWHDTGYFQKSALLTPLLHTWSLSVEEQFYIFFPFLIVFLHKYFLKYIGVIVLVGAVLSFALNLVVIFNLDNYQSSFFMLPMRAWELLVGSVLAVGMISHLRREIVNTSVYALGLVLIGLCALVDIPKNEYPGYYALLPVLGSACILYAGERKNGLTRLLKLPPIVFTGKISYSLYLWHWPIFVFANYYFLDDLSRIEKIGVLIFCFIISIISWEFIEQPFRSQQGARWQRERVFFTALVATTFLALSGFYLIVSDGTASRFDPKIMDIVQAPIGMDYEIRSIPGLKGKQRLLGGGTKNIDFVLIGDSHARAASPAFHKLALRYNQTGFLFEQSSCFLSYDYAGIVKRGFKKCLKKHQIIRRFVLRNPEVKTIFIAGRWSTKTKSISSTLSVSMEAAAQVQKKELKEFAEELRNAGKQVVIISEVPSVGGKNWDIPSILGRAEYYKRNIDLRPTRSDVDEQVLYSDPLVAYVESKARVSAIWTRSIFCKADRCDVMEGGRSLYYDDDHISSYGAKRLIPSLEPFFIQK